MRNALLAEAGDLDEFRHRYRREQMQDTWTPEFHVTEVNPTRHIYGNAGQVLREMNPSAVVAIEANCAEGTVASLRLKMTAEPGRAVGPNGAELSISSEDAGWARKWHATLSQRIERGRPWWWWLRTSSGAYWFGLGVANLLGVALVQSSDVEFKIDRDIVAFVFLFTLYGTLAALVMQAGIRRLLPTFQVLKRGERGRGQTAIAIVSTPVLAIAYNVVSYLITK